MTSKRRENINLVSFICLSFLVVSFSKQLLIIIIIIIIIIIDICKAQYPLIAQSALQYNNMVKTKN